MWSFQIPQQLEFELPHISFFRTRVGVRCDVRPLGAVDEFRKHHEASSGRTRIEGQTERKYGEDTKVRQKCRKY